MLRQTSKGWLAIMIAGGLLISFGGARPASAEDALNGKLIAAASPADESGAAAGSAAAMPEQGAAASTDPHASADSQKDGEKISVTFEEPEKDIMTKQAVEKLEVIVESLEFANADLRNVIRIIGERLNINFIFDAEDIQGKVTLRLRNIRLKDALDSILTTRKLALVPDRSGIFRIVPQERVGKKQVETHTEVIPLNWVSAVDLEKTLVPFLSEDVGKMQANEESNSLIITDVPPQIETIKRLIAQVDVAERQVLIEARLADVNIDAAKTLQSNWSASKTNTKWQPLTTVQTLPDTVASDGTVTPGKKEFVGPGSTDPLNVVNNILNGFSMKAGKGTLAFGRTINIFGDEYNVQAVFQALEQRNVVQILADPRVTTLNNVPATIKIIEKIPYAQAVQGPTAGTTTAEIEFEEAGENITVKPIITPNGFVRMEVKLEQRIFRGRVGTDPLDPPLIDVRDADTNVIVPDRSTVVLGGLRQVRQQEEIDGLPWFHRIPVIGWLFKNKSQDQTKIELILMMTPKVIKEAVKLSDHEKYWYDKIDTDWHLPDYFYDETRSVTDIPEAKKAGYTGPPKF